MGLSQLVDSGGAFLVISPRSVEPYYLSGGLYIVTVGIIAGWPGVPKIHIYGLPSCQQRGHRLGPLGKNGRTLVIAVGLARQVDPNSELGVVLAIIAASK